MSNEELFDCFGSDDEEEEYVNDQVEQNSSLRLPQQKTRIVQRDPNCGVCSQLNVEKSLLVHVKNNLSSSKSLSEHDESNNSSTHRDDGTKNLNEDENIMSRTVEIQKIIDEFCNKRAWMMNIGPEKGSIIQNALRERINKFVEIHRRKVDHDNFNVDSSHNKPHFVCVELGTYCGYGSTILAKILHEYAMKYDHIDFHLFTVEINPLFAQIAKEIVDLCHMSKYITILENDLLFSGETGDVGLLLKEGIRKHFSVGEENDCCIDFLLIDHDKDSYLSDLKLLERHGMIKEGSKIAADNVMFAGIKDYVSYMKDLVEAGIVRSRTVESMVEYSGADIFKDGDEKLFEDAIGK